MNSIAQLEALNPVPGPQGNPGRIPEAHRSPSRRWRVWGVSAAAVLVAFVAVFATQGSGSIDLEVAAQVEATPAATSLPDVPTQTTPTPVQDGGAEEAAATLPSPGLVDSEVDPSEAVARLIIPAIDVDQIVVDDVTVVALRKGPGHYPATAPLGHAGNAAIAGHRTTYGAPFHRLDELLVGDSIFVTTMQGVFEYRVVVQQIVDPDDVSVLSEFGDNRLTLTTPHPKYTNRQRLVVVASLVGEPAPPVTFAHSPLVEQIEWNDADDVPDLSAASFGNDTQPYFAFDGDADVLDTAEAFVASQFGEWVDGVDLSIAEQTERAAAVRWTHEIHETGGWVVVSFSDGRNRVWNMTMDGVDASIYQSQTGGRGIMRANRPLQVDVLRPVPFSLLSEGEMSIKDAATSEPLVVDQIGGAEFETVVTFDVDRGEHFQEVRMIVRNSDGEQVGGIATSLALPALNELAVVTTAADSARVRRALASSPEVIAGPLEWDRWQSIGTLAPFAPEFLPTNIVEIPTHEVTTFALRAVSTPQQYTDQTRLFGMLMDFGEVISLPTPGASSQPVPEFPDRADRYVVDELPSVDICRHLQAAGWARPEVELVQEGTVFATPQLARDSFGETGARHTAEFRTTDGESVGFARPADFNPWWFGSLLVVTQVDDGWVVDRWERATC